ESKKFNFAEKVERLAFSAPPDQFDTSSFRRYTAIMLFSSFTHPLLSCEQTRPGLHVMVGHKGQ
ncbi:MAG: hypothetical protein KDH90_22040, partial [Anaerolineae bacterium]|nr:hypothetical protein [Anaerolineae bacterium]